MDQISSKSLIESKENFINIQIEAHSLNPTRKPDFQQILKISKKK